MDTFFSGFSVILNPYYIGFMLLGVSIGLVLGFLPGLSGGIGIGLMLPFTYSMEPLTALVFLLSIYTGGLFGGAVTAILLNTPGAPPNIATVMDGYPMNKKGEPERAMGLALMSSFLGGTIGCVCLLLIAGPMAAFSLRFGPGEMFMVAVFGLSVVGSLSENVLKGLFAGMFGVLLGTVGITSAGVVRGTMGSTYLIDGIPMVPALIGFLALPEVYALVGKSIQGERAGTSGNGLRKLLGAYKETLTHLPQVAACALLGVVVGIMPAAGGSVAGLLAYNQSKQWSKKSERFGTGIAEGIVSCEAANNASEGGALATMFVLGIPGSSSTAMMLGALVLQGWQPGPKMFSQYSDVIYTSFSSLFLQQFVMLLLGTFLCLAAASIVRLPVKYLMPCIVVFTIVGAFSGRTLLFDAQLMIFFSIISWFMKKNDFPVMPMILGLLLGPIADVELLRIGQLFDSFWEIFRSPIVVVLALVSVSSVVIPVVLKYRRSRAKEKIAA